MIKHPLIISIVISSLLFLPIWIDKQIAPWLPGSTAWGNFAGGPLTEDEAKELAYRFVPRLAELDFTVVITKRDTPNAFFAWDSGEWGGKPQAVIVLMGLQDFPRQTQLLIFLHELAHANQLLNTGFEDDIKATEWEADVQGVKWACELGVDSQWVPYFWVWLYQVAGYEGDASHPKAYERISLEKMCPGGQA